MRRIVLLFLALSLVLCACGKDEKQAEKQANGVAEGKVDSAVYDKLTAAVKGFNDENRRSTAVILSFAGHEESLYFAQGSFSYDRGDPVGMSGRNTEVFDGNGITRDVYYKAGAYYYDGNEGKFYQSFDRALFLDQYMCTNLSLCSMEAVTACRSATTSAGTKYTLSAVDSAVFDALFSETVDLYSGLKKPQTEKTAYSNGSFVCVIDENGALQSFKISCTVTMYDTAPYYPTGYIPEEKELKHSFSLEYEVSVKALGEGVEIKVPNTADYTFLG